MKLSHLLREEGLISVTAEGSWQVLAEKAHKMYLEVLADPDDYANRFVESAPMYHSEYDYDDYESFQRAEGEQREEREGEAEGAH